MQYITDAALQAQADNIIRPSAPPGPVAAWYALAITNSNIAANGCIRRTLAARGYTPAQIAAWTDGPEFNLFQGLFFMSVFARSDLKPEALALLEQYDRRKELLTVQITDATGAPIDAPTGAGGRPWGTGTFEDKGTEIIPGDIRDIRW